MSSLPCIFEPSKKDDSLSTRIELAQCRNPANKQALRVEMDRFLGFRFDFFTNASRRRRGDAKKTAIKFVSANGVTCEVVWRHDDL